MAEIMNAQGLDAREFSHSTKPFPKIPRMRFFEIAFEPRVGLCGKHVFVVTVARQSAEGGDCHIRQFNSIVFVVLRLPDVEARIPGIEVDVAPSAAQDLSLPHPGGWARAPETLLAFDAEFGESGNQRFEVLFLSHFARWLVPGGVLLYVLPAQQLAGCAHVLASHFLGVQIFRLESPSVCCTNRLLSSPLHAPGQNGTALATPKSHSAGTVWYPQHGNMRCCRFCRRGESNCGCRRPVSPKCPTPACPSIRSKICCPRLRPTGRWRRYSILNLFC